MITKLYLTRHGETEWNVVHRMQGFKDSPLTELGRKQAEWLSTALLAESLDIIYASPSPRALQTATIIRGERDLSIETSEALMEMGFGIWEGRIHSEVSTRYPEQWDSFWNHPDEFSLEEAETYSQVQTRAVDKLQEILDKHAGQSVLIVTHTIIVKLLMAYFEGKGLEQFWSSTEILPTSLSRIDIVDHVPQIRLYGDVTHYQL
jgi:probable phosphoglycerate mutase